MLDFSNPLVKAIIDHWGALMSAPSTFAAVALLSAFAGLFVRGLFDKREINYWRNLATDYKDRLHNATPIEVANKIEHLKGLITRLQAAQWRAISDDQKKSFASAVAALSKRPARQIQVYTANIDPESEAYARWLVQLFRDNGLPSQGGFTIGEPAAAGNQGVLLVVADPQNLNEDARIVDGLLKEAAIEHRIVKDARPNANPEWFFIVVGSVA